MSRSIKLINSILVELFGQILRIEESALKVEGCEDLSMTEIHTLEAILGSKPRTMTEVSEKLKITVGTLTTAVNRLVKKGYVVREKDKDDKRKVLVTLTEKGQFACDVHEKFHTQMVEMMVKDLNVDEDKVLIKSLDNLKEFFETHYPES